MEQGWRIIESSGPLVRAGDYGADSVTNLLMCFLTFGIFGGLMLGGLLGLLFAVVSGGAFLWGEPVAIWGLPIGILVVGLSTFYLTNGGFSWRSFDTYIPEPRGL